MGVRFLQLWKNRPTDFPDRQDLTLTIRSYEQKAPNESYIQGPIIDWHANKTNPTKYDRIIGPISLSLTHLLS